MGSNLVARRAGQYAAAAPTASSITAVRSSITGSVLRTPYSRLCTSRPSARSMILVGSGVILGLVAVIATAGRERYACDNRRRPPAVRRWGSRRALPRSTDDGSPAGTDRAMAGSGRTRRADPRPANLFRRGFRRRQARRAKRHYADGRQTRRSDRRLESQGCCVRSQSYGVARLGAIDLPPQPGVSFGMVLAARSERPVS
jgi:hypothetical protein